jgi:hypothetical protein
MEENDTELYTCSICNYKCSYKYYWDRHLHTSKHKKNIGNTEQQINNISDDFEYEHDNNAKFECDICNKTYSSASGLWYHKKNCIPPTIVQGDLNDLKEIFANSLKGSQDMNDFKELFMGFVKSNQELQNNLVIAINQNTQTLMNHNNIGVQNNNQYNNQFNNSHFNLNFFLNEQCKDAININEFIESINITFDDLENTAKYGYVDGVTQIIINHLRELDIFKRPIHCSDAKRGILYFKHDNKWEKDQEEKPIAKHVVRAVSAKNIGKIKDWIEAHPGCTQSDSMKNRLYHKIFDNAMSGDTQEEQNNNIDKVIRNLIREVIIVKKP